MIAIVDYGMGNLRSVQRALEHVGAEAVVTDHRETIESASAVVLPGVGAFGKAMANLERAGLTDVIRQVIAQDVHALSGPDVQFVAGNGTLDRWGHDPVEVSLRHQSEALAPHSGPVVGKIDRALLDMGPHRLYPRIAR